jgi:hypothetical protein
MLRFPGEKERDYPFEFSHLRLHTDRYEIALPEGYAVENLSAPLEMTKPFAFYRLELIVKGNTLKVLRQYEIRRMTVSPAEIAEVKDFYRFVERAERTVVFLKRAPAASASHASSLDN